MLFYIYMFMLLISGGVFFAIIFNRRIEETIPVNIMLVIFILYLFGLFNALKIGVVFIQVLEILLLICSSGYIIKNFKVSIEKLVTPALLIFVLFFMFFIIIHKGRMFSNWDEFSFVSSNRWQLFFVFQNDIFYLILGSPNKPLLAFFLSITKSSFHYFP